MKKVIGAGLIILFAGRSQELEKSWRFGFVGGGHLCWLKSEMGEMLKNEGVRFGYSFGLYVEKMLSENGRYSIETGLHFNRFGIKVSYIDIATPTNDTIKFQTDPTYATYTYGYVSLPAILKMRTNEIGGMRYYIGFGFSLSGRWRASLLREDNYHPTPQETRTLTQELEKYNKTAFFRISMIIKGGLEYNMTGTTWLIASLYFDNGLTNMFGSNEKIPQKSGNLIKNFPNPKPEDYLRMEGRVNWVGISVGFLF